KIRLRSPRERLVGQNLGRAAEDRRPRIHRRVPRHHADVFRSEVPAQRQELLIDQGLDGARVDRSLSSRERPHVKGRRHERLPGSGRRIQDHIPARKQLQDRLLLLRIKLQPPRAHRGEKVIKRGIEISSRSEGERCSDDGHLANTTPPPAESKQKTEDGGLKTEDGGPASVSTTST